MLSPEPSYDDVRKAVVKIVDEYLGGSKADERDDGENDERDEKSDSDEPINTTPLSGSSR